MANLEENSIVSIEGNNYKVIDLTPKGTDGYNIELVKLIKKKPYNIQMRFTVTSKLLKKFLCNNHGKFNCGHNEVEFKDGTFVVNYKDIVTAVDNKEALKILKFNVERFSFKLQKDTLEDSYKKFRINEDVVCINYNEYKVDLMKNSTIERYKQQLMMEKNND